MRGPVPRPGALVVAVALTACGRPPPPDPPAVRDCRLRVAFEPAGVPRVIGVVGDFDGEDPMRHPLRPDEAGVYRAAISLPPGRALYQIEVDGRRFIDPKNPLTARARGETWSVFYADDCSAPRLRADRLDIRARSLRARLRIERVDAADGLAPGSVRAEVDGRPIAVDADADGVDVEVAGLPPGKHRLRVRGRDVAGRALEPFEAPFWVEPDDVALPFRWEDAIIYQVVVDRFAADGPFTPADRLRPPGRRLGGHLRGLLRVLRDGYFERLGVNVLWISPLNRNPDGLHVGVEGGPPRYEGYHGYWPVAPREVDPRLGSAADVEALVAEAHGRGIRILMDIVLNHVHREHPYVAAHPDWFGRPCICGTAQCPWGSHIETCWFTDYLPDLTWEAPEILETQVEDALWWMERFDLDGLRVDAVPMMPRFVTRHLTRRVHRRFEGLAARHYLLGETFTGADGHALIRWYLGPWGLDGQFDFPLMWALRQVFAWETAPLWTLDEVFAASREAWAGSTAVMALMVGNHDVPRFLSEAAGQITGAPGQAWDDPPPVPDDPTPYARMLLAQTFVLTAPGAPVIYYGDELGMPGAGDPDNRRPMRFGGERSVHERALQAKVERLGRLRRCLPALRRGRLRPLRVERDRYAYVRDHGDGAPAVVVLNRAAAPADLRLPLPADLDADGPGFVDVVSGGHAARDAAGHLAVEVGPRAPAVLVPASSPCARLAGDTAP